MNATMPLLIFVATVAFAPQSPARAPDPPQTPGDRPNVLVVLLDDIGVEKVGAYGESPPGVTPPCTPNMDALATAGVLFRNAWTNNVCSPTRAQLLTGRHGFRTGIGGLVNGFDTAEGLAIDLETTLPQALAGYATAAVGKWHLAAPAQGLQHPLEAGFGAYAGSLYNLNSYSNWVKTFDADGDGVLDQACELRYATTDSTDDAIGFARTLASPWFLYVAYNAPHMPVHAPPPALIQNGCESKFNVPVCKQLLLLLAA